MSGGRFTCRDSRAASLAGTERERITLQEPSALPDHPKLRPVEPHWITHQGQPYLYLKDPINLADDSLLVPQALASLLALCDGTRDVGGLQAGLLLRTGVRLPLPQLTDLLDRLDAALLLDSERYRRAVDKMLREYHEGDRRAPSHADLVYPADPEALSATLDGYCHAAPEDEWQAPLGSLAGMVCPHIDYERGHRTYAELWRRAAPALEELELVIMFGTDHAGSHGTITPTLQSYATPLGVLPTEKEVVHALEEALKDGDREPYAEEVHHLNEHSIELASVWLHYFLKGRSCPMVPVLCGSFQHFVAGDAGPETDEAMSAALEVLKEAAKGRKTLVIAAGDLAHVGPAFGDPAPVDRAGKARLAAGDAESLAAICEGDADEFFRVSQRERDARKVCGLPPIYMALRLLDGVRGVSMGYDQCPADEAGGSLVSIAGALLYHSS